MVRSSSKRRTHPHGETSPWGEPGGCRDGWLERRRGRALDQQPLGEPEEGLLEVVDRLDHPAVPEQQ